MAHFCDLFVKSDPQQYAGLLQADLCSQIIISGKLCLNKIYESYSWTYFGKYFGISDCIKCRTNKQTKAVPLYCIL